MDRELFTLWEALAICVGLQTSNVTIQAPEHAQDVWDYPRIYIGQRVMFICLALEMIVSILKGENAHRVNDFVMSIITYFPKFAIFAITDYCYTWFYIRYNIIDVRWDNPVAIFTLFVAVDLAFYWYHRTIHEVNLFWAFHQVHHSSEDLNLTHGYRQPLIQECVLWIVYLPFVFFVNPSMLLLQVYLSSSIQYFLHTEYVSDLGPLEYILNTPSHHRVHHGRNRYCIDKNYGGVFIIFDRIFGTFQQESKEEKIAYGLVHPINTFENFTLQEPCILPDTRRHKRSRTSVKARLT